MKLKVKSAVTFDRSVIRRNWKEINESPYKRAGLLVRKIARGSIRRDSSKKQRPSKPGRPPKSRAPGHPLKLIYSVVQAYGEGVMVGPVGFGHQTPVPERHEKGKSVTLKVAKRHTFKRATSEAQRRSARRMFQEGRIKSKKPDLKTRVIKFDPRPFMVPALEKAKSKIPEMWRGSVDRVA
jgi:hypothetical protein